MKGFSHIVRDTIRFGSRKENGSIILCLNIKIKSKL